jgi:membrane-associated PAP2 superfamily phosphatase
MVFMILIGAALFSLVFRGFEGDELVQEMLSDLSGGKYRRRCSSVMLAMFLLGFILDFIEITFVVVPIVGPVLLAMGIDPVWLGNTDRYQPADILPYAALSASPCFICAVSHQPRSEPARSISA